MKVKPFAIILIATMAVSFVACGSGESTSTVSSSTASASTTASRATATVEKEEKEEEIDSKFGNRLDAYQGTWEYDFFAGMIDWLVIINEDIYYYSQTQSSSDRKYGGYIEECEFRINSNGELICHPQYGSDELISINDDGNIEYKNGVYEKVSDEQTIPTISEPEVGMTELQVQLSTWGKPSEINRTTTADSVSEEWVYGFGTIYLTDGVVTSIEEKGIK